MAQIRRTSKNFGTGDDQYHNAIMCYDRNGQHGTCVACPSDDYGWSLPELCDYATRYDHTQHDVPLRERFRS